MLERLARLSALLAGALVCFMVVLTSVSIIGRETIGRTITGDFELVGLATGAAVGLFMPLCQLHRGNIMVDFFTARAPARMNAVLDRVGALLLGLTCALLAWRAALGGLSSWNSHSSTMLLGVPEWLGLRADGAGLRAHGGHRVPRRPCSASAVLRITEETA